MGRQPRNLLRSLGALTLAAAGYDNLPARAQVQADGASAPWVEVRSANFVVRSNAGEKRAREIDDQLERIRAVFRSAFPPQEGRLARDPRVPLTVFAPADASTFFALLPREWAGDEARRPPGVFLRTADRYFVLLRADLWGDQAYQLVYHEYFHVYAALNLPKMPVWLSEGLADFYAGTLIRKDSIESGRGMLHYKLLLRDAPLLPLSEVLLAKQDSALYTDPQRSRVFYAQAWALVHMLQFAPEHQGKLAELLSRFQNGQPLEPAQREVLGDFAQLQKQLAAYIRRDSYPSLELEQAGSAMPTIASARQMTDPEMMVAIAEYHLAANRLGDARRVLQQLMASAPDTPGAHDVFGQFLLKRDDTSGAWAEFSRAILLGSQDWRTRYALAMLLAKRAGTPEELLEVERHLNAAAMLNPESPEAASALAGFLLDAGRSAEYALQMAVRAAALEPEQGSHQILISRALEKLGRLAEAQRAAERAVALATNDKEKATFESYRKGIIGPVMEASPVADYRSTVREVIVWVKDAAAEEALRRWKAARAAVANIQTFVSGRILSAGCPAPPELRLELETEAGTLKLNAANVGLVAYYVNRGTPPRKFDACVDLKNKSVDIVYRPTPKASSAGQILAIEMK